MSVGQGEEKRKTAASQDVTIDEDLAWHEALGRGDSEKAWDLFVDRHHQRILATIRGHARRHDVRMDVFEHVCDELRRGDLKRLRSFKVVDPRRARFTTWLVAVVRNLTRDWFRRENGRHARNAGFSGLPPLQQDIFRCVLREHFSHIECFEYLHAGAWPLLTYRRYLKELRQVYRFAAGRHETGVRATEVRGHSSELVELCAAFCDPLDPIAFESVASEIAGLSDAERLAVELYVVDERKAAQVARAVGWPSAKTVYNRIPRCLAAVKSRLTARGIGRSDL